MLQIRNSLNNKFFLHFLVCCLLIIFSYYFLDRPLARWVYMQHLQSNKIFYFATFIPNAAVYISLSVVFILFAISKITISDLKQARLQACIIAIALGSLIAIIVTRVLKYIFGRIGPEYWVTHNFHLGAYGFYLFHGHQLMYQDFPSGHTAASFAIIAILCCVYPKLGWLSLILGLFVVAALLCTQSHYFSDCIAGAYLGVLVGMLTARFFELAVEKN